MATTRCSDISLQVVLWGNYKLLYGSAPLHKRVAERLAICTVVCLSEEIDFHELFLYYLRQIYFGTPVCRAE